MAAEIVIRPAAIGDVYALAATLRPGDRAEIEAVGREPRRVLRASLRSSLTPAKVAVVDGEVAAMWGMGGEILSDMGVPWLMTGTACDRVPVSFLRIARAELEKMLELKPQLENYIMASYTQGISLLQALGFRLDDPVPCGRNNVPFRRFHLHRDEYDARQHQLRIIRPGAVFSPFIIYTAGRSRTAWLSSFLSYGRCCCHNEIAIRLRSMEDMVSLFARPGTGSAETAVAPGWRLIQHYVPGIKSVVVRRPLEDIIASFARSEVSSIASIDEDLLRKIIAYENRCLDKISSQPSVLTVDFKDLEKPEICSAVFEHCLPYKFDKDWWEAMKNKNIQSNVAPLFSYYRDNRGSIEEFKRDAKRQMIALARAGAFTARPIS